MHRSGRHFLQIPGPTNVPERVLRAMAQPTIDHRGAEFATLGREVLDGLKARVPDDRAGRDLSRVRHRRLGGGARQHAVARRPGAGVRDRRVRAALGRGGQAARPRRRGRRRPTGTAVSIRRSSRRALRDDREHADPRAARRPQRDLDRRRPAGCRRSGRRSIAPAIRRCCSSTRCRRSASIDLRHDEWGIDVTLAGSQKGLMLPPGLSFNAISDKALAASRTARCRRSYWAWDPMLRPTPTGFFPYTPATNLLYGLREALRDAERGRARAGVCAASAAWPPRRAPRSRAWGLEIACRRADEYSPS